MPVLLTTGELPIDLCLLALTAGDALDATPDFLRLARWWLFLIWFAFMAGRSVAVALAPSAARRWQRAVSAAALFTALIYLGILLVPVQRFWVEPREDQQAADDGLARVTSEQVWVEQPQLLDEALSQVQDERPGIADLYFVQIAGDLFAIARDERHRRAFVEQGNHGGHALQRHV